MNTLSSLALVLLALLAGPLSSQEPPAAQAPAPDRLGWWREARVGLFVHLGPVALLGTELSWSRGGERRG